MAHHGYIPRMKEFLNGIRSHAPRVLEIGIDRGVTTIPVLVHLDRTRSGQYGYLGIDIKVQEPLLLTLNYLHLKGDVHLSESNSLVTLPQLVADGQKFDLVLLDGDHNYSTVAQELSMMPDLLTENGMIVVDDYEGRWSTRDLWYSERSDYVGNEHASKPTETEKHGVKPAVDEFLARTGWRSGRPIEGEPILLRRV